MAEQVVETYIAATKSLLERISAGLDAISAEVSAVPVSTEGLTAFPNEKALFDALRPMLPDHRISPEQFQVIKAAIAKALLPPDAPSAAPQIGITAADYAWAAKTLAWSVPQIKAVDLTESSGGGWFTDMRASILALDGPGGFLSGSALPKILYEAHVFARNCDPQGEFNDRFPNLSSAKWNKALYVGGQGEYERLWKAIQLDRNAAFSAISVGRYQILGENHKLAGYGSAEAFFDAMCVSERAHLEAFVSFIINSGLADEGRKISANAADCEPFAKGYNGSKAIENGYPAKLAAHYKEALAQ